MVNVLTDSNHCVTVNFVCGRSQSVGLRLSFDTKKDVESLLKLANVTCALSSQAHTAAENLKLPQLAGESAQA
jgi:hypothetical protein